MYIDMIFCSRLLFFNWLQNHLIPCPFKKLTGFDCPGCGFQRSVIALFKGNLNESLHLYPATIPFLLAVAIAFADSRLEFDKTKRYKKALFIITGCIITLSYTFKLYNTYS